MICIVSSMQSRIVDGAETASFSSEIIKLTCFAISGSSASIVFGTGFPEKFALVEKRASDWASSLCQPS